MVHEVLAKCVTVAEAARLGGSVAELRKAIGICEKRELNEPVVPQLDGPRVLIRTDDYLPPVLVELKKDAASEQPFLRLAGPISAVLDCFDETFGQAQIIRIEPKIHDAKFSFPGVSVATRPAGWAEKWERLRQEHKALVIFVKAVRKELIHGAIDFVHVSRAERGLKVLRNDMEVITSMGQDRALATLIALGIGEWIPVDRFCEVYSGSKVPEPDKYFGTAVTSLVKVLPSLSWDPHPDNVGSRKIIGLSVETTLTPKELFAFGVENRDLRKPSRKAPRKPAHQAARKEEKQSRVKSGKNRI